MRCALLVHTALHSILIVCAKLCMLCSTVQMAAKLILYVLMYTCVVGSLSLWLIGTVRAEPEPVISRAWVQSPELAEINCFRITGVHALRLISRTGKRV